MAEAIRGVDRRFDFAALDAAEVMRDRFDDAPVSCANTISTNCIFQFAGTIRGVKNAIIVAAR